LDSKDINLNGFTKNVILIIPIFWNFNYQYDMDGLEHVFKKKLNENKFH
jgi:hypothetical protein